MNQHLAIDIRSVVLIAETKNFGGVEQQSDTTVEGSLQNEESAESSIVNCVKVTTAKPANRAARLEIAFNCSVFSSTSLRFFSTNLNL